MAVEEKRDPSQPPLEVVCSRHFLHWLRDERVSLAFTTYQTNRLFLVGLKPDGRLSAFERLFDRAMGLWATPRKLLMSSRYQLFQFENPLAQDESYNGYDRLYVPRLAYTTGEIDMHDVVVDRTGRIIFVNTLYSCLATVSERYSFTPLWRPPFVSRLAPEDRCHLNGLALRDGEPAYVTAVSRSDAVEGWRERRADGGCVVDVSTGEIVSTGLSMPHSPRWYRGRLWLLNSGTGELGSVDPATGRFEPLAFCPGYLRGLAFHRNFAVVGLSKPRHNKVFTGLPLDERLKDKDSLPRCGLMVIDLDSGDIVHWMQLEGVVMELYDVQVLRGVRLPMSLGFRSDEVRRILSVDPAGVPAGERPPRTTVVAVSSEPAAGIPAPGAPQPPPAAGAAVSAAADAAKTTFTFRVAGPLSRVDLLPHDAMTFPRVSQRWQVHAPRGPLFAATAQHGENLAGAALAELSDDGRTAEIVSLQVADAHRRRGAGRELVRRLTEDLANRGCLQATARLRSDWVGTRAAARIFQRLGWTPPQAVHRLFKTTAGLLSRAPWLEEAAGLPEEMTLFPWKALTDAERAEILDRQGAGGWFPPELTPFQEPDRLEPLTSLGLRWGGRVAGWMITHRTLPDTVQYTALFVDPELQRREIAIRLVAAAVSRQIDAGIDKFIYMVDLRNPGMLGFVERYLAPHMLTGVESLATRKRLGQ